MEKCRCVPGVGRYQHARRIRVAFYPVVRIHHNPTLPIRLARTTLLFKGRFLPPARLELDSYFHTCPIFQGPKGGLLIVVQSATGEVDGTEAGQGNGGDDMGIFGGQ